MNYERDTGIVILWVPFPFLATLDNLNTVLQLVLMSSGLEVFVFVFFSCEKNSFRLEF